MSIGHWVCKWANYHKIHCEYKEEVTSTNRLAKQAIDSVRQRSLMLHVADHQTNGRGRFDRTWQDVKNSTLITSWTYLISKPPQHLTAPLVGLALYETFKLVWPSTQWGLKSPNDIYFKNKKVAGLLIESIERFNERFHARSENYLIIGLGINVSAAPDIATVGCLNDLLAESITEIQLHKFLDQLKIQFEIAVENSIHNCFNPHKCEELKNALNAYVGLEDKILLVDENSNFYTNSGQTSWFNL